MSLKRRAERDLERARGSERTQEVQDEERRRKEEGKQAKVAVEASRCLTTEMRRNLAPGELGWEKKGWWGGSRKLFQHENGSSGRVKGRRMLVVWVKKRERAFGRAHLPLSFLSKDSHHASSLFFFPRDSISLPNILRLRTRRLEFLYTLSPPRARWGRAHILTFLPSALTSFFPGTASLVTSADALLTRPSQAPSNL